MYPIDLHYCHKQIEKNKKLGKYPISKWVLFCNFLLENKFKVKLHKARSTVSKYILVQKGKKEYKVRFSNHKPSYGMELTKDSDFYVGVSNLGVTTSYDAIKAIFTFFNTSLDETKIPKELRK
jgi:hypothetical protein